MKWILLLVIALLFSATHALAAPAPTDSREQVLSSVSADLCKANVAFLGEPNHHGSAKSIQFKADLAERLVDHCHFDTIIFEGLREVVWVDSLDFTAPAACR